MRDVGGTATWNRDSKPTGDGRGESRDATVTEECAECGDPVPADEWHPVAAHRNDGGEMEIHVFCSERCRSSWQADAAGDD